MFFLVLFSILPIWFFGFTIVRLLSFEKRLEIILPTSLFGGITLFIFLLNILSYIFHPPLGIYVIYILFILFGLLLLRYKAYFSKIDIPKRSSFVFIILSLIIWGGFLFRIIGHMSLTGDPSSVYQTIGRSFTRGNFPIYEPWQPDIKFSYHYGPSIFLGTFHVLTKSTFDLIQRATSLLIVLMLSHFLIWVFKRHLTFKSLISYELISIIALISFGNWIITFPILPFQFSQNFTGLIEWAAKLPTAHMNFDTYGGATVSLEGLVFFYHELIGIITFIWILWLSFTYSKERRVLAWLIITVSLASISIINEMFLPLTALASSLVIFFREFPFRNFISKKNILLIISLFFLFIILVVFQGGTVTESIFGKKSEYPTVHFFPNKKNVYVLANKDISIQNYEKHIVSLEDYQKTQQASTLFPKRAEWLPFRWFHPGFIFFYISNIIICFILYLTKQKDKLLLCSALLISAAITTLIYNSIYVIGNNTSRLISIAYCFLGVNLAIFSVWVLESLANKGRFFYVLFVSVVVAWLSIPSFFPSLAQLLIANEPKNKLIFQESEELPAALEWIRKNLPYNARLLNLVSDAGVNGSTLAKVGIFTPTWTSKYRAYSMDSSPEYFDVFYTLNPTGLNEFKITHLLIDSQTYSKIPKIRQEQLESGSYFTLLYQLNSLHNANWERVYRVNNKYSEEAKDLPMGTFRELNQLIISNQSKVYIDKFLPLDHTIPGKWVLRRALIFALKDKDLYYELGLPSGNNEPYPHIEASVRGNQPSKSITYDFLALSNYTQPESICSCKTEMIWRGFEDNIVIWKVLK